MKLVKILFISSLAASLFSSDITCPSYSYGHYLFTDMGTGAGSYRDEGTSPLTYQGPSLNMNIGYLSDRPQHIWEFRMDSGYMLGVIGSGYLLNYFSEDIQLSYLHSIPLFNHPDMNFNVGGKLSGTVSGSMNDAFENASFNVDIFAGISAKAQYTYAFIIPEKIKKRRTIPATRHALICHAELPVILFNARPEFSYVMDGNNITYNRHIFLGGYSMQTTMSFRSFLPNGNAFDISYVWKMYTTGKKDIYLMEKAGHILQLSYYFKLD